MQPGRQVWQKSGDRDGKKQDQKADRLPEGDFQRLPDQNRTGETDGQFHTRRVFLAPPSRVICHPVAPIL